MKRVSFKVAKALKEVGYPQRFIDCAYYEDNKLHHIEDPYKNCRTIIAYAPTYIEAWLWLWREKKIYITFCEHGGGAICSMSNGKSIFNFSNEDPEESIIEAIRYLIDNDLLK